MTAKNTNNKKTTSSKKKFELEKEIKEFKKELKQKQDKIVRISADFQNYQKRKEKEIQNYIFETKKSYLLEMLDLLDLIKNAYKDENPKQGLKLLIKNLEKFFENENIKVIECIGKKFDHNYHHALTTIEKKDCEDNIIIEEVKKGYKINEKIIRPSHVIVSKNEKC